MWTTQEFLLNLSGPPDHATPEMVFGMVWRFGLTAPGFCLLDVGRDADSPALRSHMLTLKSQLSEIGVQRSGLPFVMRPLGRFDQQETTKFHLDGAPEQSMLMLGYEPSAVRRLFLADYSRCAFDLGIKPQQFLNDFNPMFRKGEEMLARYVTELPQPEPGHWRILLINNSFMPFEAHRNPLGVMHKAEVTNPMPTKQRIVNSMMLAADGGTEAVSQEKQREFVSTEQISTKVYG